MISRYDKTIQVLYGPKIYKAEIGLEIEVEGRNLYRAGIDPFWSYHQDGSLRGEENAEYVLTKPIERKQLPDALNTLFRFLRDHGSKIRVDSPNTSVHVHLNVQSWTVRKTVSFITLWYIFEKLLVDWCGEERAGNLFCLRGSDAEYALSTLASAIRYQKYNQMVNQDGLRYAACNYAALGKFGTLEFRSLAGIYDEDVIQQWVDYLCHLKDYANSFQNPSDIIIEFSRSAPEDFSRNTLGRRWEEVCRGDYGRILHEGVRFVQPLAYAVDWNRGVEKEDTKKSEDEIRLEQQREEQAGGLGEAPMERDPRRNPFAPGVPLWRDAQLHPERVVEAGRLRIGGVPVRVVNEIAGEIPPPPAPPPIDAPQPVVEDAPPVQNVPPFIPRLPNNPHIRGDIVALEFQRLANRAADMGNQADFDLWAGRLNHRLAGRQGDR